MQLTLFRSTSPPRRARAFRGRHQDTDGLGWVRPAARGNWRQCDAMRDGVRENRRGCGSDYSHLSPHIHSIQSAAHSTAVIISICINSNARQTRIAGPESSEPYVPFFRATHNCCCAKHTPELLLHPVKSFFLQHLASSCVSSPFLVQKQSEERDLPSRYRRYYLLVFFLLVLLPTHLSLHSHSLLYYDLLGGLAFARYYLALVVSLKRILPRRDFKEG